MLIARAPPTHTNALAESITCWFPTEWTRPSTNTRPTRLMMFRRLIEGITFKPDARAAVAG